MSLCPSQSRLFNNKLFYRKGRPSQESYEATEGIYCDIAGINLDRRQKIPQPNLRTRGFVPELSLAMQSINSLDHGSIHTAGSMSCFEAENHDHSDIESDVSDVQVVDNDVYGSKEDEEQKENGKYEVNQHSSENSDESASVVHLIDNDIYGCEESTNASKDNERQIVVPKKQDSATGSDVSDVEIIDNDIYG